MNSIYYKLTAFSLIALLLLSPSVSFAKNNGNKGNSDNRSERNEARDERGDDDDDDNDEEDGDRKSKSQKNKQEKKLRRQCFRSLREMILSGQIQDVNDLAIFADCFRPFGNKKFGGKASSTDVTAPLITNLSAQPNRTRAQITWQTNENSDSAVFWSTSPGISSASSSVQSLTRNERVKNHSLLIENLSASTTYYLVVRSRDASKNTATSSEISFRTHSLPGDAISPVISNVSYMPGTTTVRFSWQTNENADSRVYYSTSSPLHLTASSTRSVFDNTLTRNHLLTVSGLNASTTYYVAVESVDPSNNKTTSPSFTLLTQ